MQQEDNVSGRIFVQGDRDASGFEGDVVKLARLCAERKIGVNVGESGEIVRIMASAGPVRVHKAKQGSPNVPEGAIVDIVDCYDAASVALSNLRELPCIGLGSGITCETIAWDIRLAVFVDTSKGFIFFPGREGTLAHLIPVISRIAKGERDRGKPCRRVALVGWDIRAVLTLRELFGDTGDVEMIPFVSACGDVETALDFITAGPAWPKG